MALGQRQRPHQKVPRSVLYGDCTRADNLGLFSPYSDHLCQQLREAPLSESSMFKAHGSSPQGEFCWMSLRGNRVLKSPPLTTTSSLKRWRDLAMMGTSLFPRDVKESLWTSFYFWTVSAGNLHHFLQIQTGNGPGRLGARYGAGKWVVVGETESHKERESPLVI